MKIVNYQLQDMPIANLTQRTISNIGGKGTGKTTLLKMAIQELPANMPAVIFDALDVVDIPGIKGINIKRSHIGLGKPAALIVKKMIKQHKKVIIRFINLVGFEIVEFMDSFIPGIHMKDGMYFFDEIHEYCPEIGTVGGKYSYEVERLIRHTRNDNNGVWMTTQRPAFASKKVLGLSDFMILFRVTYPTDLKVVKQLVHDEKVVQSLPSKPFLEGWYLDFDAESGKYLAQAK